ncbi:AlpA family transcriptional regulator [Streptomyces sp. DH37]|uniref:helix-turn-helix transcriptional regulator n=1 Tax=Streptomyces sp. DH37 TaxID=3040122 RepID=UPI002441C0D0|nr:hypothetical protein [Streptomyces sp. DH37]MDG9703797.1 hypothetical protein [Streptomyces sp. DH37]
MTRPKYLDLHAVAELTGLTYPTVRGYHNKAAIRRRDGTSRPGDFPPPDDVFSRVPLWLPDTIETWMANRPGRGTGGGRPRKNPNSGSDA